ncbi:hypothetical protein HMPREF9394_1234 [Streptococcus sanguinis SK1057]|jgi:hypothetical protein|uniref:hypothetical protein n=1 Tax=Streptococcus sanguinis TaxID=1305 RepID=UPI000204DB2A|nr:hypothetical protein [Streptococcus sanguinis]EGF06620.1 hypothetical protein HMPREF9394_1234 [Streptococcus sanguinis SK1057]
MEKLNGKKKLILTGIIVVVIGYIALRYYLKPEWFDSENIYYTVYNYKVTDIKPKKKIVKDLNIEFVHDKSEEAPQNQEWTEKTLSNWNEYYEKRILHVTFTDGSKSDIPIGATSEIGPAFSNRLLSDSIYQKLSWRFPEYKLPDKGEHPRDLVDILLFLYVGDTLYQVPEATSMISYQLKNPKTGKMQTYYEYGSKPGFNWTPIFFIRSKKLLDNQMDFFDDYHNQYRGNYWEIRDEFYKNGLSNLSDSYYYRIFYSDELTNLPLSVSTTGSQFKMTITHSYVVERLNDDDYKVKSTSKTYTDENKDEYISEVLNQNKKESR